MSQMIRSKTSFLISCRPDPARDRGYLKTAEDQVIDENLPEISPVLKKQDPLGRPGRGARKSVNRGNIVRVDVDLESEDLCGIGIGICRWSTHIRKLMSRTDALGPPRSVLVQKNRGKADLAVDPCFAPTLSEDASGLFCSPRSKIYPRSARSRVFAFLFSTPALSPP